MSAKNVLANSTLYTALVTAIEPLVNALDMDVGEGDQDTGHERPSQKDVGIRIVIGGICQVLHNQLFGDYTTSTGSKVPNIYRRFMDSEEHVGSKEFQERVENGTMSTADMKALDWYAKNEARFNWLTELDNVFKQQYQDVTGETWKPYERKAATSEVSDKRKAILANIKARFAA
jgi:hypothetical protein